MTTLFEIKYYIHNFIKECLNDSFKNKIYWIGERKNVPEYPYCLLNVIAENKDKRTSHHDGFVTDIDTRESVTTRYKTCTITVGIYNGWTEEDDIDMDIKKAFAYKQIDCLEGAFEDYPINNKFSIQNISPIRPLPEVVAGGYMYRYEFDLTIGYNEKTKTNYYIGKEFEVDIDKKYDHNSKGADNKIHFNVELDDGIVRIEDLI